MKLIYNLNKIIEVSDSDKDERKAKDFFQEEQVVFTIYPMSAIIKIIISISFYSCV